MKAKNLISIVLITMALFSFGHQRVQAVDLSKWNGEVYIDIEDIAVKQSPLTENQAREIIVDEASKANVHFTLRTRKIWDDIHYMFEYFDAFDTFMIDNCLISTFSQAPVLNQSRVYYFKNNLASDQKEVQIDHNSTKSYSQLPLSLVMDAMDRHREIACAYISEDDCSLFLYGSSDALGNSIYEQLTHSYSTFYLGIFTSCDEATLRSQVRYFLNRVLTRKTQQII